MGIHTIGMFPLAICTQGGQYNPKGEMFHSDKARTAALHVTSYIWQTDKEGFEGLFRALGEHFLHIKYQSTNNRGFFY